ncbi:MAG: polymer-forming cytoskeletal protein [Cyclobacteriaceae bacterium]|nr:polymer-forming cytoskeletal protein [Cyclobacteriaceae bacterium]
MFTSKEEKKVAEELTTSTNTIGKGTTLQGNIEAYGNIRVEGKVAGNLTTKSKVVLGQSSIVDGDIIAQNGEIEGEVKGKIEVSEILTLKPTAIVHGNIVTNKLIVDAGAKFNGGCKMGVSLKEIKIGENGQEQAILKEAKAV